MPRGQPRISAVESLETLRTYSDGYQVYLPHLAPTPAFRWSSDRVHAITFPMPDDRPGAPAWIRGMNWYDWGASDNRPDRIDGLYLNMVWSQRPGQPVKRILDRTRPLLYLNEPDVPGQAEMTPEEVARGLWLYRDYPGELYGFGVYWPNLDFHRACLRSYWDLFHEPPRLDGIHLHVYWPLGQDVSKLIPHLRAWRREAAGRPILVTEWNLYPVEKPMLGAEKALSELGDAIKNELEPRRMFYFSYRMPERFSPWDKTSLDQELGQAWLAYMAAEGYPV